MAHQFGIDHDKLTSSYQGLDQKLVGVDAPAHVLSGLVG